MSRFYKYEAILLLGDKPVSVNKFGSITNVCIWLDDVDLDIVDVDIYRISDNTNFDAKSLLEVWHA